MSYKCRADLGLPDPEEAVIKVVGGGWTLFPPLMESPKRDCQLVNSLAGPFWNVIASD
jgi:hypothetical protein